MNNNNFDGVAVEAEVTTLVPLNTNENPLVVEDIADSDDHPSDDNQISIAGSFGIGSRVRGRKGTSAKALKSVPKKNLDIPIPTSRTVKQKESHSKAIMSIVLENPEDEDIHGKTNLIEPCDYYTSPYLIIK